MRQDTFLVRNEEIWHWQLGAISFLSDQMIDDA